MSIHKTRGTVYSKNFFNTMKNGSYISAHEVIPYVLQIIQPESVVDVGCGVGTWLSGFKEAGVKEIFGIDGEYVDKQMLQIPENYFLPLDLSKPISLKKKFDLVVSLEVAEHLDKKMRQLLLIR